MFVLNSLDRPSPETRLGERIRLAREMAGFTQSEAAQSLGITAAALSQYESGKRRIEALTVDRLARLYGVPVTYFFVEVSTSDQPPMQPDWETALRTLANHLAIAGKTGIAKLIQQIHNLEELYQLTATPFPGKPHPPFAALGKENFTDYEVAEFAQKARRYYNLGIAPLLNVKGFLDAQGYQVFAIALGLEKTDISGLFFLHPQLGPVVVFNENQAYIRSQITLCHEIAHHLFHWDRPAILCRDSARADLLEDFANRFASYFLIPPEGLQERLEVMGIKTVKHPEQATHIARYFGVSYQATIYRLEADRKLGAPIETFTDNVKPMAIAKSLGYGPSPYQFGLRPLPPEERLPRIFVELSYRALTQEILSLRRVAEILGISDLELEDRLYGEEVADSAEVYV
ncbi:ImmA/IrrE family metallo-endopeptidase [Anabaena sp. UHCC 0204]|uniref:helix-turn-helix domain-containing protein n=1 Tax=Anabaena sp. UHCC 0204 TaxID=2590009 RepID=UPI001444E5C7|nr:XRE family transcriptional regulator [Anabaena sp. UHCC 0204]MTJ10655.1 ImmA/IrrE family metallo-endopeptidase [Anabaena sp. UHCC 0204]